NAKDSSKHAIHNSYNAFRTISPAPILVKRQKRLLFWLRVSTSAAPVAGNLSAVYHFACLGEDSATGSSGNGFPRAQRQIARCHWRHNGLGLFRRPRLFGTRSTRRDCRPRSAERKESPEGVR